MRRACFALLALLVIGTAGCTSSTGPGGPNLGYPDIAGIIAFYEFDEVRHRLMGERNRRVWRLGDAVRVRLVRVDLDAMQLQFVPVDIKPDARAARKPGRRRR